jgi:hypothetical protein
MWSLSAIDRRLWTYTARRMKAFADPQVHADALFVRYVARQSVKLAQRFPETD